MAFKEVTGKDLKLSRSFKDMNLSMGSNPFTKDVSVVKNNNAIKQSIRNLVLTSPGEKLFQPWLGCRVKEMLFEPLDMFTAQSIQDEIINTINQHDERIQLQSVEVIPNFGNDRLNISIEYKIVGIPIVETVDFVLQRPE